MNSLRSVSISRRLWLILIVSVVMLLTLGMLMLKQIHDDLYQAKALKTQHVVQTASGILNYYHDLETAGTLTFLFFGYTNCPDVCPLHMANLAGALHSLPP